MKKILAIIILFFLSFGNIFAEVKIAKNLNLNGHPAKTGTIYKINFSGKKYEEIQNRIVFNQKDILEENEKMRDKKIEYIDNTIPILQNLGKEKLEKLLNENKIYVYGSRLSFGNIISSCHNTYANCVFSGKKYNFLNTKFKKTYKVFSDKNEEIIFDVYPISPDYYDYDSYDSLEARVALNLIKKGFYIPSDEKEKIDTEIWAKRPIVTFFDTSLEFYNLEISGGDNKNIKFEKNYELVKLEDGNYMYIPHYKAKIKVKKGENLLFFNYDKYTTEDDILDIK